MVVLLCLLLILWIAVAHFQSQRIWRWWNHRLTQQLHEEAEQIRNGLLQESFVMRRNLELMLLDKQERAESMGQHCLEVFEQFHQTLEQLSDRLSPPHSDDSFALALQARLAVWKYQYPRVGFRLNVLPDEDCGCSERHRVVLMVLDQALRIVAAGAIAPAAPQIDISFSAAGSHELTLHMTAVRASGMSQEDWSYLCQLFRLWMGGQVVWQPTGTEDVTCYFRW